MRKNIQILAVLFLSISSIFAQVDSSLVQPKDSIDYSNLSLDELLKLKSSYKSTELEKLINQSIEVASRKPLSLKKTPSIISVINADEIQRSGARDIIDVLNQIPGIQFGTDVQGSVGIAIRGMWAQEGKVLILLDGQEMNENAYGTPQFAQQYPIDQIKKIEVIRGPGSSNYGGYAEYAVINIITYSADDINGLKASANYGTTGSTFGHQNLNLSYGKSFNKFKITASAYGSNGQRSNFNFTDQAGNSFSMIDNSSLKSYQINVGIQYKSFSFRYLRDNLYTMQRDNFDASLTKPYGMYFLNDFIELKYQKQLTKKFNLQVKTNYKNSYPWFNKQPFDSVDGSYFYQARNQRYRGLISGVWDINYLFNFTFGAETFIDIADKKDDLIYTKDSTQHLLYHNIAPFAQLLIKTRFANITLGERLDYNNAFGHAFSPRIGMTKKWRQFNFKLLYAESFRAPAIENIQFSYNGTIQPEKSKTLEFEALYQINRKMYVTVNFFRIETFNTIKYFYFQDTITNSIKEGYTNFNSEMETEGFEIEYKYKSERNTLNLSYSYYMSKNEQDLFNLGLQNLGLAQHKFGFIWSIQLTDKIYFTPSMTLLGKRVGIVGITSSGENIYKNYTPQNTINFAFGYKNIIPNLDLQLSIYNITNTRIEFIQPYDSYHNPIPGLGREFLIKLAYQIK